MIKQIRFVATAALVLALQAGAIGQASAQTPPLAPPVVLEVQRIAPQLVTFAGSDINFQNLVNGLSQGISVTLTTVTADGFLQTVTFTPASALSATDIARTLETARQQLISRGIANPTAEQIGVTLAGGLLPTPAGAAQVSGLLPTLTSGGIQTGASLGASRPRLGTVNPPSNLVVDIRPVTPQPQAVSTSTSASPGTSTSASPGTSTSASPGTSTSASPQTFTSASPQTFTSDSTRIGNTSDTPLPPGASQPGATVNSSTGVSNGAPSPAVQMQGRK